MPNALATLWSVESDGLTLLVSILEIRLTDSPVASATSLSSSFLRRRSLRRWNPMATDSSGGSATGSGTRRSVREDEPRLAPPSQHFALSPPFAIRYPFRYALRRIVQQSRRCATAGYLTRREPVFA